MLPLSFTCSSGLFRTVLFFFFANLSDHIDVPPSVCFCLQFQGYTSNDQTIFFFYRICKCVCVCVIGSVDNCTHLLWFDLMQQKIKWKIHNNGHIYLAHNSIWYLLYARRCQCDVWHFKNNYCTIRSWSCDHSITVVVHWIMGCRVNWSVGSFCIFCILHFTAWHSSVRGKRGVRVTL